MPTGYTDCIERKPNLSLREYALRCARAFGACIEQRDEDGDVPPRAPKISSYHKDEAAKERARLDELRSMMPADAKKKFDAVVAEANRLAADSKKKHEELRERYTSMRSKVEAWEPPTPEHENLKKFMLSQIDLCKVDWDGAPYKPYVPASPEAWLAEEIDSAVESLERHEKYYATEVAEAKKAGDWIAALEKSLPA